MKEWKSPELTVLVRSKPEEAVLIACKTDHITGPTLEPADNCLLEPPACQGWITS